MITGTVMYDIGVEATNEKDLQRISEEIQTALKAVKGVTSYDEVDSDVVDTDDGEDE
jgi:hypothetical protein